jgi:hypothetical protein
MHSELTSPTHTTRTQQPAALTITSSATLSIALSLLPKRSDEPRVTDISGSGFENADTKLWRQAARSCPLAVPSLLKPSMS